MDENYIYPSRQGFMCIPVLEFLNGMPWNVYTKNLLVALRPSRVREVWSGVKCDARLWRVTVYLKGDKDTPRIDHIEQEVAIGLDGDSAHGRDVRAQLVEMGMRRFR